MAGMDTCRRWRELKFMDVEVPVGDVQIGKEKVMERPACVFV